MYSNKLIACVKADGKVLREQDENVFLPFGSEYTLWFKNEHTRKVQINVEIDGTDVLFNKSLIINAGETADLKGFARDMVGSDNRAFKFITKTQEISDFRGDKIEDGLIKITYQFEKEVTKYDVINHHHHHHHDKWYGTYYPPGSPWFGTTSNSDPLMGKIYTNNMNRDSLFRDMKRGGSSLKGETNIGTANAVFGTTEVNLSTTRTTIGASYSANATAQSVVSNDPGITVEGSATKQSFQHGYIGALEDKKHTMVFQLKGLVETGEDESTAISEAVTVKSKKQCPSCGKKWKSAFEYCPNDGTFLRFPQ